MSVREKLLMKKIKKREKMKKELAQKKGNQQRGKYGAVKEGMYICMGVVKKEVP